MAQFLKNGLGAKVSLNLFSLRRDNKRGNLKKHSKFIMLEKLLLSPTFEGTKRLCVHKEIAER